MMGYWPPDVPVRTTLHVHDGRDTTGRFRATGTWWDERTQKVLGTFTVWSSESEVDAWRMAEREDELFRWHVNVGASD